MVALECDARDDTGFLNDDVAAGLDPAVPGLVDFIIEEADITAAFRALAGLCLGDGGVRVAAREARDLARRLGGIQEAHQQRARGGGGRAALEGGLGSGWEKRLGVRVFAGHGEACDRVAADHAFPFAHLEVCAAGPALRGDHECGFGLSIAALGALHLDAMAMVFIRHGAMILGSKGRPLRD